jgi:hypothetical protein
VLFSGEFRKWFDETFDIGDTFYLDIEPAEGEGLDALRIAPPAEDTEEQPLDNLRVIAVQPDWTDNRGLLGYHNPLTEEYVSSRFLDLLVAAQQEADAAEREGRDPHPYFIVLDEMNLARVEQYFADFLSALESGEPLDLGHGSQDETPGWIAATRRPVPRNIFFTGTVNIDETTSMFSPKVLDRAFTIEVNQVQLRTFGQVAGVNADLTPLVLHTLPYELVFHGPPTHGTQQELDSTLQMLFAFAVTGGGANPQHDEATDWRSWRMSAGTLVRNAGDDAQTISPSLRRMGTKLWRMLLRLDQQGFTAFVE